MNYVTTLCLFLLTAKLTSSTRPKFRSDYVYEKGLKAFYKLHWHAQNWYTARIRCEAEGARLYFPETADEADALTALLSNMHKQYPGAFVGIHDIYFEGIHVTIDGESIHHTVMDMLWESYEPAPAKGQCVAMRRSGKIFKHPCDSSLPFICKVYEKDISYISECDSNNKNWKNVAGSVHCFFVSEEPQTWIDAYGTCLAAGGYIAVDRYTTKKRLHFQFFKEAKIYRMPDSSYAFIGYHDLLKRYNFKDIFGARSEDHGVYFKEAEQTCPTVGAQSDPDKRCGAITKDGYTLADCDTPAMFVCQKWYSESDWSTFFRKLNIEERLVQERKYRRTQFRRRKFGCKQFG